MQTEKKIIFITGCSSGIGYYSAIALQKRGYRIIASCRKESDREKLKSLGLETIIMDMNDSLSIHQGFEKLMQLTNNKIDILINNAGYGQAGALEDMPRDALRDQFETNVFGLMELTGLAIKIMRQQHAGRIINISSLLGYVSLPFRGAYNASKYAVEGLSDTLRLELQDSGIKVITIEPGPIESHFRETAVDNSLKRIDLTSSYFARHYEYMLSNFKAKKTSSGFTKTPEAVVKKLVKAIESRNPRAKYPVTLPAHLFSWFRRLFPTKWLDRVLLIISKNEISPPEAKP